MRTLTLCLTIAAGGLLGPSLGEDLLDQMAKEDALKKENAAKAEEAKTEDAEAKATPSEAPEAPALLPFDASCKVSLPSQGVTARTLPGIRIWSAKILSKAPPKIALFEIERWVARDTWSRMSFQVRKKERIGGPKVPKGQYQPIDFSTRWAFLDVAEQEVMIPKVRIVADWDPQRPGVKIGEKQETDEKKVMRDVLRLAYLDANGNPAMGKDEKLIEVTVEAGAQNPVELPVFAEQELLPAAPQPEAP
jgi:hypothetical protein